MKISFIWQNQNQSKQMNQTPINTLFNFKNEYFDTYNETFLPSDESFDFIERQSLPQDFVDYARESTSCLNDRLYFLPYINDDDNEKINQEFHLKVQELLMLFGLSFCKNDYLDYNTIRSHREILEEELLIVLEEKTNEENQEDTDEILNEKRKEEGYFSEIFPYTIELLKKTLKSAIFLFNVEGDIQTYCIDKGYLSKSPIILVYSKTQARLLLPTSFIYYSQSLKSFSNSKTNQRFYSICEYRLVEDHWIAHTKPNDLVEISRAIYNLTKEKNEPEAKIREDLLSFNFESYLNKNIIVLGLIGQSDDIFRRMGFDIELTTDGHIHNYPKGFMPRNRLHPELVLYIPKKTITIEKKNSHLAYIFLFMPYLNPILSKPAPSSPSSPTYEEAASDAYTRMKNYCSQIVLI